MSAVETEAFRVNRHGWFWCVSWKRFGLCRLAFTKRGAERMCRRFQRQFDTPGQVVR